MKCKHIILILIFILTYSQAKAEPRCETFYKKLYNDKTFPTDADSSDIQESTIGFNLRSKYDEEKEGTRETSRSSGGKYAMQVRDKINGGFKDEIISSARLPAELIEKDSTTFTNNEEE